jgi:hypothetical protein
VDSRPKKDVILVLVISQVCWGMRLAEFFFSGLQGLIVEEGTMGKYGGHDGKSEPRRRRSKEQIQPGTENGDELVCLPIATR